MTDTNDRAPSATEGPPAGGGWPELVESVRTEHQPMTISTGDAICQLDLKSWPCTYARLATAFADTEGAVRREASLVRRCGLLRSYAVKFRDMLATAERRVAEALEAAAAETALHDLARQERAAAERRVAELDHDCVCVDNVTMLQGLLTTAERRAAEQTERAEVAEAGLHRYAELYEASHAAILARQAATEKQEPARHPSDCECYSCWQRSES